MKSEKLPSLTPATRTLNIHQAPGQPSAAHEVAGQVMPVSDLHKMALTVAMSNLLKRKKGQKKGT